MQTYLGWDCANKTLAWAQLTINTKICSEVRAAVDDIVAIYEAAGVRCRVTARRRRLEKISALAAELWHKLNADAQMAVIERLLKLSRVMATWITLDDYGVCDVLNGVKVSDASDYDRTVALAAVLQRKPVAPNVKVIIEHQPPKIGPIGSKVNTANLAVSYQLMYHYMANRPTFIDPRHKNRFTLRDDLSFDGMLQTELGRQRDKASARYKARKDHSAATFTYLLTTLGLNLDVPRAKINHVADAALQIIAYAVDHDMDAFD